MATLLFINSLEQLHALPYNEGAPLFCDTETDGLYGPVRLIQIYQTHWEKVAVIDMLTANFTLNTIAAWLESKYLVFHNSSYDIYVLGINPAKFEDTLYLARIAKPWLAVEEDTDARGFGLDKVVYSYGLTHLYKDFDKKLMQKSDFSFEAEIKLEQYQYAATDVIALSKIFPELIPHTNNPSYIVDKLSTIYANKYCRNGISIDKDLVAKEMVKIEQDIADNTLKLNGLNPNSPKQCKEALGVEATDKPTLMRLISEGNELAMLIYNQRRLLKRRTMLESYMHDKVFSTFKVAGAATGRFTASGKGIPCGINSQQIPRDLKYLFYNPSKDYVTIEADYATLELRLAAAIFGDENMAQQLRDGLDLHTEVAKALSGKSEITKDDRFKAKAVNFGFVYGMSAKSFKEYAFNNYGLNLSEAEAKNWRDTYFRLYPQIARYHDHVWKNYKNYAFVQYTALGKPVKPKLGTDAINAPVQGSGAECTKLAIHYMLKEKPEMIKFITNVVHDSIKLEVPIAMEEEAKALLEKSMLKAWDELLKMKDKAIAAGTSSVILISDIPMKVDIEVKQGVR